MRIGRWRGSETGRVRRIGGIGLYTGSEIGRSLKIERRREIGPRIGSEIGRALENERREGMDRGRGSAIVRVLKIGPKREIGDEIIRVLKTEGARGGIGQGIGKKKAIEQRIESETALVLKIRIESSPGRGTRGQEINIKKIIYLK